VGDIKHSILNPTDFAEENGDCWVPMDGRAIPGTKLADTYGWANVPDMSGLFVRATEYNDGNDPDRMAMSAPTVQGDENKEHTHTMTAAGGHTHTVSDSYFSNTRTQGSQDSGDPQESFNTSIPPNGESDPHITYWDSGNYDAQYFRNSLTTRTTSGAPDHTHTIENSGNAESRPKNMNFFIYIRVD
jgi:hypothetical protein